MKELELVLQNILDDKNANLLPENLKKGVTCLGVEGVLEPSGPIEPSVKLFTTQDEMNQSEGNEEGDLAIVYGSTISNWQVDTQSNIMIFPQTVTLQEAFTDFADLRFGPVDESTGYVDFMGNISKTSMRLQIYADEINANIRYTSDDGITYTKTQGNERVELPVDVYYERVEEWNDVIGYFIQTGINTFEGIYKYVTNIKTQNFKFLSLETIDVSNKTYTPIFLDDKVYNTDELHSKLEKIGYSSGIYRFYLTDTNKIIYPTCTLDNTARSASVLVYNQNKFANRFATGTTAPKDNEIRLDIYDLNTDETETKTFTAETIMVDSNTYYVSPDLTDTIGNVISLGTGYESRLGYTSGNITISYINNEKYGTISLGNDLDLYIYENKYLLSETQFDTTDEYVYGKTYYGKNGVGIGTLCTDISLYGDDVNAEIYQKIRDFYDNAEPIVIQDGWTASKNIKFIPSKSDGTSLLDTSSVTDMNQMFYECTNLKTVPLLNTSSVTNMNSMFVRCKSLETIPLLDTSHVNSMRFLVTDCENLKEIPLLNTSSVEDMDGMFLRCYELKTIPLLDTSSVTTMQQMFQSCMKLTGIPLINTEKVTNMEEMFFICGELRDIPLLNTSSVTNMYRMFESCPNLSDDSLNNILKMCANSNYESGGSLNGIGLTREQAEKCQTLSNWSEFEAAGWSTGYSK